MYTNEQHHCTDAGHCWWESKEEASLLGSLWGLFGPAIYTGYSSDWNQMVCFR